MTRSGSISFNTGEEDNSAVDLTTNKYAGKYIGYLEDSMGVDSRVYEKFNLCLLRLNIVRSRRVMVCFCFWFDKGGKTVGRGVATTFLYCLLNNLNTKHLYKDRLRGPCVL